MIEELESFKKDSINEVCEGAQDLLNFLSKLNDAFPCREWSIAKTKLEEMVMWAVKGITAVTPPTEEESDDKINE